MSAHFVLNSSVVQKYYEQIASCVDIVSYSSKTNTHVTRILDETTQCMFSLHFERTLTHVSDHSRVLFFTQAQTVEDLNRIYEGGVRWFVVDNHKDLDVLKEFMSVNQQEINVLLRTKVREHTIRTERHFVFGMDARYVQEQIVELRNTYPHIKELGIHFHRKTQNMSEWNLQYAVENLLPEEIRKHITIINIGGGLPAEYSNTNVNVIVGILEKISGFTQWAHTQNWKTMIEPGRFISAPAVRLHTTAIRIYDNNVVLDTSVYNADMDALIVPVKLTVLGELPKGEGTQFVLRGNTPDSMDLFRYRVYLERLEEGDEVIFENAGAYNFSSDFCDMKPLPTRIVEDW